MSNVEITLEKTVAQGPLYNNYNKIPNKKFVNDLSLSSKTNRCKQKTANGAIKLLLNITAKPTDQVIKLHPDELEKFIFVDLTENLILFYNNANEDHKNSARG